MDTILFINFLKERNYEIFKKAFANIGYEVEFIDFSQIHFQGAQIKVNDKFLSKYCYIFVGLLANHGEKGYLLLDYIKAHRLKSFIYGSVKFIDNKLSDYYFLDKNKLAYIPTISTDGPIKESNIKGFGYPLITKPIDGKQGKDVMMHKDFLELNRYLTSTKGTILIQPFIKNDGDYRVLVIKGKIIGIIKRARQSKDEFRNNISLGGSAVLSDLPQYIKKEIEQIIKILPDKTDILGIDIVQDSDTDKYYCMEINRGPQFAGFERATGINIRNILFASISEELEH